MKSDKGGVLIGLLPFLVVRVVMTSPSDFELKEGRERVRSGWHVGGCEEGVHKVGCARQGSH